jgi:TonB family protein
MSFAWPTQGCGMKNHLTVRPMVDVRQMYAQQIDAARMALIRGDRTAAAESFRAAIGLGRDNPSLQRDLAPALVNLAKLEQELGRPTEAERLLLESLEIGERLFGPDHPSLSVVLNELSRLHIRQSHHARAHAVLERLLRISRTKGEENPEVATALAGLGLVLRGLGNHDAAEHRYRDALRIREKVLAPDHMAIVVTLEQLSDTCAAQGNCAEAIRLLQRALPKREAALGPHHATVRALRSRIATLDYRGTSAIPSVMSPKSTAALPAPAPVRAAVAVTDATAVTPQRPASIAPAPAPRRSNELVFLYEPEVAVSQPAAVPQPAYQPRARIATPTSSLAVANPSPLTSPTRLAPTAHPAHSAQAAAPALRATPEPFATSAQVAPRARSGLPNSVADMAISVTPLFNFDEVASSIPSGSSAARGSVARYDVAHVDWRPNPLPVVVDSHERAPRRRTALYASVGLAAAALVTAALTFHSNEDTVSDYVAARADVIQAGVAVAPSAAATLQLLAPGAQPKSRAAAVTHPELPSAPVAPRSLARLSLPSISTTNVDSLVRASTSAGRDSHPDQIGTAGGLQSTSFTDDASGRPPVLIGSAPIPYFPDALRSQRTEGEVVVRFRVDERGRVDASSMKVVKSDHELFTLAVRSVLPRFRFTPARSPAPESKPRSEWVDFRAEFTAKN